MSTSQKQAAIKLIEKTINQELVSDFFVKSR